VCTLWYLHNHDGTQLPRFRHRMEQYHSSNGDAVQMERLAARHSSREVHVGEHIRCHRTLRWEEARSTVAALQVEKTEARRDGTLVREEGCYRCGSRDMARSFWVD
jgi:hypothetical protein